jgi:membrane protein required for colicin V production
MQTYDFLMLAVLVGTAVFGFVKGMAWQIASLASIAASYFAALKFSSQLAPVFGDSEPWNRYVAMLVIYIAISFAIWLAFRVVAEFIDRVKLKEFDRQMGALFGVAKGVVLCVAITFFAVSLLPADQKQAVLASRSGHYIGVLLSRAESVVPPEFRDSIGPLLHKVNEQVNPDHEHADERPVQDPWPSTLAPSSWPQDVNVDWPDAWPESQER